MHAYTYTHACMHAYIHTYKYIHTHIHTCMHTYIHTYIYTYMQACIKLVSKQDTDIFAMYVAMSCSIVTDRDMYISFFLQVFGILVKIMYGPILFEVRITYVRTYIHTYIHTYFFSHSRVLISMECM